MDEDYVYSNKSYAPNNSLEVEVEYIRSRIGFGGQTYLSLELRSLTYLQCYL